MGLSSSLFIALSILIAPSYAEDATVTIGVGDTTFTVQGYTSPSALVTIIDGSSTIGTVTADSSGFYTQQFTAQSPGLHTLKVYAQDRAARMTTPVVIEVNVTEHTETVVSVFLPPTIQLSDNSVNQGETIKLTGEGAPNSAIIIYLDNSTYTTTMTDSNGYWQYSLPTVSLQPGEHQLFIVALRSDGSQSYPSANQSFIVQPTAQSPTPPPPATVPSTPSIPVVLDPRPGTVVNTSPLEISGAADPGTRIEIWNNGKIVGSVFADANGRWRLSIPLVEGNNAIKTRSCDGDLCSDFSALITILFTLPTLKELLWFELKDYSYYVSVGDSITLDGSVFRAKKPYTFVIDWGDGVKEKLTNSLDSPKFQHRFDKPGKYGGFITITDSKGDSLRLYFTTTVDPAGPPIWVIAGFSFLFLLSLLLLLLRRRRKKQQRS